MKHSRTQITLLLAACILTPQPPAQAAAPPTTATPAATATESQATVAAWIWHDEGDPLESAPAAARYFRKTFRLGRPETVVIDVTADDRYELFVNGDPVGAGDNVATVARWDVSRRIRVGRNVVAVKALNDGGPAGLLVRVLVTQRGGTQLSIRSDASWRSAADQVEGWNTLGFDDAGFSPVKVLGEYGKVSPWQDLQWQGGLGGRFRVPDGFLVEQVASPELTGSVVNMTFDGQGRILFSREGGPVFLLTDRDGDRVSDFATEVATQVNNCQGLLSLDGDLYAVGDGPDKTGLYRLSDTDGDDRMDNVTTIGTTRGGMGEHGPHAILLGPDGWLYWDLGNHAHIAAEAEPDSPLNRYYEGYFLQPKYEDAGGHAVGVKAPGGTIIRLSRDDADRKWYRVAGGFRNQFDFAFSAAGEIFTFDSDMEWDVGLPWYRPVRVNHAVPGAEFGWRSGAAKWPPYYFDSLPAAVDVGRGSPTGVVFYHHNRFPEKYYDAFFISDWAQGIIYAVHLQRDGATWKGTAEAFATGNPLNVTDVDVGPDGALYFSCGGRGTEGGIFRIVSLGSETHPVPEDPVEAALAQPQPEAAWARQRISAYQRSAAERWGTALAAVARASEQPSLRRIAALNLLQQFGPVPGEQLLVFLSREDDPLLRAHAAYFLGVTPSLAGRGAVQRLLTDRDPLVRRRACEAVVRAGIKGDPGWLVALLGDSDRWVRFAARRAIQDVPRDKWTDAVLDTREIEINTAGMLALLQLEPDRETLTRILRRQAALLGRDLSSDDLLDLLRTIQLALLQTDLDDCRDRLRSGEVPENMQWLPTIRDQLLRRYPSGDARVDLELSRMLAGLGEPKAVHKIMDELARADSRGVQIHLALCARYISQGWTSARKRELFEWLDRAYRWEGGHSFSRYIQNIARDCLPRLDETEQWHLIAEGDRTPFVARLLVAALDADQARAHDADLIALYGRLRHRTDGLSRTVAADRHALLAELVAALGRAGTPEALAHLRERYEDDPDRRSEITAALAAHPAEEHWELLVRSLDLVGGDTLRRCLVALERIPRKPEKPAVVRSAIVAGLKLGDAGKKPAARLLTAWLGDQVEQPDSLAQWQSWFAEHYPDYPPAALPKTTTQSRWGYDQLIAFLTENPDGLSGDPDKGADVFEQAQCIKCHRFGNRGEGIGPDLSTVRRRFQRKEILEAIYYPSQIISDQYRSAVVTTKDGLVKTGLVAPQGQDAIVVLDAEGNKTVIAKSDVELQEPANTSSMPEGLLNPLSLRQIADLFAYLERAAEPTAGSSPAQP